MKKNVSKNVVFAIIAGVVGFVVDIPDFLAFLIKLWKLILSLSPNILLLIIIAIQVLGMYQQKTNDQKQDDEENKKQS